MFTGVVTHIGIIKSIKAEGDLRVTVACEFGGELKIGESVSVNGACLTVVERKDGEFTADISEETQKRTAARWQEGVAVNLERPLRLGDTFDGHLVNGHIDGIATIKTIVLSGNSHVLQLEAPKEFARFIAEKGSVALDGVSLTVNKVEGQTFWVNIIPHTWDNTTFKDCKTGDALNMEIDMMARYADRLLFV